MATDFLPIYLGNIHFSLFFVDELKLSENPETYTFLRQSGCIDVDTVDDVHSFKVIKVGSLKR